MNMDWKKLEDILNVLRKSRKELWNLNYEELDDLLRDAKDYLDALEILSTKLELGIDKLEELMMDFEDDWEEAGEEEE